jgi:hypothetical protein
MDRRIVNRAVALARRSAWGVIAVGAVAFSANTLKAHKPITSKYTYNEQVFPVLRDRCGRCHFTGGIAPMSLLSYQDAVPWAESIRQELEAEKMPPWYVDSMGPMVRGDRTISAQELDTIITWAAGGTPEGDREKRPVATAPHAEWTAGTPDLILRMPSAYEVRAGTLEETCAFTLPTGLNEDRWVKGVDLLPTAPSMARDATISAEDGTVLAAWVPGVDATMAARGTAFRLPAGTSLRLDIHYKKTWRDERNTLSDQSAIGLYFTGSVPSVREIRSLTVERPGGNGIAAPFTVVAVRPLLDQPYASVEVNAVLPDGKSRRPLLRLHAPRPEWRRRYWLSRPIDLPPGSKFEVRVTPVPNDSGELPTGRTSPFRIAVDFVSRL